MSASRKISAPVILGVWALTAFVFAYTFAVVTLLKTFVEWHLDGSEAHLPGISRGLVRLHLISVPCAVAIFVYGTALLRQSQISVAHLAWYVAGSLTLAAFWQGWASIAHMCIFSLQF
jgi:hypothetical protein